MSLYKLTAIGSLLLALLGTGAATAATDSPVSIGKLLIVGGALQRDNEAIYRAFLNSLPRPDGDPIAIVPVASGQPVKSAQTFREHLIGYGVAPERVIIVPLAVKDDPSTAAVNESAWRKAAYDQQVVGRLQGVGGVWFTGGDQMRIATSLLDQNSSDSPLLRRLREMLAAGAVIGGTSAGAAMMSDPMIAAGDSLTALNFGFASSYAAIDEQEKGRLFLSAGLGFFTAGLVDQHFDRKARLGRLALALTKMPSPRRLGFGVDENSAMLVSIKARRFRVIGPGNVTVLDGRRAVFSVDDNRLKAEHLQIHVLSDGDVFNIANAQAMIAADKKPVVGNEAFAYRPHSGGGIAVGNPRVDQILGFDLLDNSRTTRVERYSFTGAGHGVIYRFRQTDHSMGYWRYDNAGRDQYTALNVLFDIIPVNLSVEPLPQR
ncbi:cyanophycinase [Exilibacterium tricleocarpae]|uniref:Cyanophycinase n=1 Tax=Exilibacterium tricleocarpae TaxID=2591008 RepID=A0A545TVD5_9GAMM|nr:cyanophycinase [Exilibacterium tricleocarpae]TQV81178.1 cyanophycinase [Exilibacterium tricleocarpae]